MAPTNASPPTTSPKVPRGRQDRQALVPLPLLEGKGKHLQEQASLDGTHSQGQGGEDANQELGGTDGGQACQEQGYAREEAGSIGREEGWYPRRRGRGVSPLAGSYRLTYANHPFS